MKRKIWVILLIIPLLLGAIWYFFFRKTKSLDVHLPNLEPNNGGIGGGLVTDPLPKEFEATNTGNEYKDWIAPLHGVNPEFAPPLNNQPLPDNLAASNVGGYGLGIGGQSYLVTDQGKLLHDSQIPDYLR